MEGRVAYLHIHTAVDFGGPFEGRALNYDVVQKILYERIIIFSPKMRNIYAQNTLRGPRQVPRLPSLKHTTVAYITLTIILCENMKPIEHVLLHPICVLSHLMCAC